MGEVRDEEYSRVTSPERYDIVHARAHAWTEQLRGLPGVEVDPLAPAPLDRDERYGEFDRGVRITSDRPGTLPLLLLQQDAPLSAQEGTVALLQVSVVRPDVVVFRQDCVCDACDHGSAGLLGAIDGKIAAVVGGPFVVLRGDGWNAQWHPDGGSSSNSRNHRSVMESCRRLAAGEEVRLPGHTEVFAGRSWLR
ncbi:hypothetical protein HNR02_003529 [Amycolatopsis endophytica]|uniref:Uncharacterized protein n=2 Tax=Amycolatopsis endophytica TaxID=860233 RepID=A0A853B6Q2_9PSEU|nr:hypothetical protein [Amycolatopsis endophytica]